MAKLVGIVGKPNCGKSTFFNAATMAHAEMADYPFTTIKPNRGVGYVKIECPCRGLGVECNPKNSICKEGKRFVPIELLDVAGIVPGAHLGKGLGNQFLDDLRQGDALIHIVDASGGTDEEGKSCETGSHDPAMDVDFLKNELELWYLGMIKKHWEKIFKTFAGEKEPHKVLAEKLSALGVEEKHVKKALQELLLDLHQAVHWTEQNLRDFSGKLREMTKPIVVCANKVDKTDMFVEKLKEKEERVIPASADSELALRRADEKGIIKYVPGSNKFDFVANLTDAQKKALEFIQKNVLDKFGSTGVQKAIDTTVFEVLNLIPVYPVEDEHKYTDKKGNVLPDTHLVPNGTTARELAYRIHTDIGKNFICGVDARTKRKVGADYVLKENDIISFQVSK